jgi:hypothetical protein
MTFGKHGFLIRLAAVVGTTLMALPLWAQPDLSLAVVGGPNSQGCLGGGGGPCTPLNGPVRVGVLGAAFLIQVFNKGSAPAMNVTLTIVLPPSVAVSAGATSLSCATVSNLTSTTVTCTAPSLQAQPAVSVASVVLAVDLPSIYPYQNGLPISATVVSAPADANPANNATGMALEVLPPIEAPVLQFPAVVTLAFLLLLVALRRLG